MLKRRPALIISLILIVVITSFFLVIPEKLTVASSVRFQGSVASVIRSLHTPADWQHWCPGEIVEAGKFHFRLNNTSFLVTGFFYNSVSIRIGDEADSVTSRLAVLPAGGDSLLMVWDSDARSGRNLIKRWSNYRRALRLKKTMDTALSRMEAFLGDKKKVYGIDITPDMSTDSTLLMTEFNSKSPPGPKEIFDAVERLQRFAASRKAKQTNPPWKMQRTLPDGRYNTMVAIPVDQALKDSGAIVLRRYVPWKEITAQVTGGDSAISRGFHQFRLFLMDYQFRQMATPYQIMVTNRWLEKDSSKWITRFSCPIP